MYINKMNQRIKVYSHEYQANDYLGYDDVGERLVCECWAEVITPKFKDMIASGAEVVCTDLLLITRKNKSIERGMVVSLNDTEYDIISIDNFNNELTRIYVRNKDVGNHG